MIRKLTKNSLKVLLLERGGAQCVFETCDPKRGPCVIEASLMEKNHPNYADVGDLLSDLWFQRLLQGLDDGAVTISRYSP